MESVHLLQNCTHVFGDTPLGIIDLELMLDMFWSHESFGAFRHSQLIIASDVFSIFSEDIIFRRYQPNLA